MREQGPEELGAGSSRGLGEDPRPRAADTAGSGSRRPNSLGASTISATRIYAEEIVEDQSRSVMSFRTMRAQIQSIRGHPDLGAS